MIARHCDERRLPLNRLFMLLSALFCLWMTASTRADDQPQWGQRHSRNIVSDETGLPDHFDPATGAGIKWSVRLGSRTYSTPVISQGRVLIGTNNDRDPPWDPRHKGDRGVLLCLSEQDGSLNWKLVVPKLPGDPFLDQPHYGVCSPATVDGDRVYIVTNRAEVVCLDLKGQSDGNDGPYRDEGRYVVPRGDAPLEVTDKDADILWVVDMPSQIGIWPHDSAHTSVLVDGRYLYINTGNGVDNTHRKIRRPNAPSLIVLDKMTGRLVAQDDEQIGPRIFHCTWSSPALGVVGGRRLIFFCGGDGIVYAFEALPQDLPVASVRKPKAFRTTTETVLPHRREGSQDQVVTHALKRVWKFDCDPTAPKENVHRYIGNRRESPSNILSMPVLHNNRLYVTGGGDIWWGKNEAWIKCIDATQTGDITATGLIWSHPLQGHACTTPAVDNGLAFAADCRGHVDCVDAETGRLYWTHKTKGDVWASTLVADGKVYVGSRRDDFWILAAAKKKKVIASIRFDSPVGATATAANGVLFVTTLTKLYAVQGPAR
jgi:outer membrane protein assembly factor BamB